MNFFNVLTPLIRTFVVLTCVTVGTLLNTWKLLKFVDVDDSAPNPFLVSEDTLEPADVPETSMFVRYEENPAPAVPAWLEPTEFNVAFTVNVLLWLFVSATADDGVMVAYWLLNRVVPKSVAPS